MDALLFSLLLFFGIALFLQRKTIQRKNHAIRTIREKKEKKIRELKEENEEARTLYNRVMESVEGDAIVTASMLQHLPAVPGRTEAMAYFPEESLVCDFDEIDVREIAFEKEQIGLSKKYPLEEAPWPKREVEPLMQKYPDVGWRVEKDPVSQTVMVDLNEMVVVYPGPVIVNDPTIHNVERDLEEMAMRLNRRLYA